MSRRISTPISAWRWFLLALLVGCACVPFAIHSRPISAASNSAVAFDSRSIQPAAASVSHWTGLGANNKWSTAHNWQSDNYPGAHFPTVNYAVDFTPGAAQLANANDFGTEQNPSFFDSLMFSGGGYNLSGTSLILENGMQSSNASGDNNLSFGVYVPQSQSYVSGNPGTKLAFNSFVIFIAADQTLTLDGAGDFVFNALVQATSGSCNLVKNGTGTANVGGDGRLGSIGGRVVTTLNDGTLLVTGTTGITTVTGGTLASQVIGSVGTITATGGTIAPGGLTAPGILTSGATTFNSATTFDVQLNGTSPGGMGIVQPIPSEYDHLDVTGPVELGGSTLQLQVNFTPAETDQFTIINNLDGVSQLTNMPVHYPTTGTFKGLPEGAIFSVNGVPFKITYRGGDGNDVVLTGVPKLSINDVSITEGNSGSANATFTVSLSTPRTEAITVDFGTADGTATAGSDYGPRSGTRVFNPGQTSETITIPILGDTIGEADETFFVILTDPVGAVLNRAVGKGTIVNDDGPPTPSQLSINDVTTTEGDSGTTSAVFTVTLSPASSQAVAVDYFTSDNTATAGSDYQFVSSTLVFNPGTTTRTITVPIKGDTVPEATETFFVNLTNASNAGIAKAQGTGTINDNDVPTSSQLSINDITTTEGDSGTTSAVFTVTLSPASNQTVSVD